jgi:hypothetical protein
MSQRRVPAVRFFRFCDLYDGSVSGNRGNHAAVLEVPRRKLSEDHLGEALIKPGDSVIVLKKWRQ